MPLPSPKIALIANGEILSYTQTKLLLSKFEKIIAVDGGLNHCEKMNITPDMIIGDLDSASNEALKKYANVKILKYPNEKNESDLELAIQELFTQGVDALSLFGVLGQRVDHLLYTLHLIARYPSKLVIESEKETIVCLQKHNQIDSFPGQTISLIPLGLVEGVSTKGLQWELENASFDSFFMSLSNICLDSSFSIRILSGTLLCCLQKDKL